MTFFIFKKTSKIHLKMVALNLKILLLLLCTHCTTNWLTPAGPDQAPQEKAATTAQKPCLHLWGALDFGSGGVRAEIAEVNVCTQTITRSWAQAQESVSVIDALKADSHNHIPDFMVHKLVDVTKIIMTQTTQLLPAERTVEKWEAVGTSVYRIAANGAKVSDAIAKETGIQFTIVSQEREAEIAFLSATSGVKKEDLNRYVVLDLGGGSAQVSVYRNKAVSALLLPFGVKGFYERVKRFKNTSQNDLNPLGDMGKSFFEPTRRDMTQMWGNTTAKQALLKNLQSQADKSIVIGVGGIWASAIPQALPSGEANTTYTLADIDRACNLMITKTSPAILKLQQSYQQQQEKNQEIDPKLNTKAATGVGRGATREGERRVHETYTSEPSDDATTANASGRLSKQKHEDLLRFHTYTPTNLLMARTIMEVLNIKSVRVGTTNLTQGILLNTLRSL